MENNLVGIVLAAGKGKRMKMRGANKVTLRLSDKPIIMHITHFMQSIGIKKVVVVVGFAGDSVMNLLRNQNTIFAKQKKRLGTGHALYQALKVIPDEASDVFVVYGDDAVFYNDENKDLIEELFRKHFDEKNSVTFLTIEQKNPSGLGRILRDKDGRLKAIIEEKDASLSQKRIKEINPGCFIFKVSFLRKYIKKIKKSPITNEYYLTSLIDLAIQNNEKIQALNGGFRKWRGINTPEELLQAEELLREVYK